MPHPIILGITGASGAIYGVRLLEVLLGAGRDVHLSISTSGRTVIAHELKLEVDLNKFDPASLSLDPELACTESVEAAEGRLSPNSSPPSPLPTPPSPLGPSPGKLHYYHQNNFMSPMASGSFVTAGMVICPCSGTTLSAIAAGAASNLIQRAAEVHLKERRKLILVPRETPLSLAHIDNMRRVTEAGAVVLPASPGWYYDVTKPLDLVDFIVARICDQLGVEHKLSKRWGASS